jgi:hypothetical protein
MGKETYKPTDEVEIAFTLNPESRTNVPAPGVASTSKQPNAEDDEEDAKEVPPGNAERVIGQAQAEETGGEKEVSCVSWSSTGGSIAVGYCYKSHNLICGHHGNVGVWSLFLKTFSSSKPTLLLDSPVPI